MKQKIAVGIGVLVSVLAIAGCSGDIGTGFTSSVQGTTTSQPPQKITLPEVEKQNAAIIQDKLRKLGLKNVKLASVDPQAKVVVLPQDWTVVSIEPASGTTVATDDVVVLKVTKHP